MNSFFASDSNPTSERPSKKMKRMYDDDDVDGDGDENDEHQLTYVT